MKTRILAAVVLLPVLIAIVFFAPHAVFGIFMGALVAIAAIEFFNCTEAGIAKRIKYTVAILAAIIPIGTSFGYGDIANYIALFLLMIYLFGELMSSFKDAKPLPLDVLTVGIVAGYAVPFLLTSLVRLDALGHLYIALPFLVAFSSDSGAYFVGVFFGKHKLVPKLSPKKTVEGSVGGFLTTIIILAIYGTCLAKSGYTVSYIALVVYAVLGSCACQFGDLSFSAVKRICGIKDYGNLIPGHGGILDRFDGMVFVAALVELMITIYPAF